MEKITIGWKGVVGKEWWGGRIFTFYTIEFLENGAT
jgi:hypothetical protein